MQQQPLKKSKIKNISQLCAALLREAVFNTMPSTVNVKRGTVNTPDIWGRGRNQSSLAKQWYGGLLPAVPNTPILGSQCSCFKNQQGGNPHQVWGAQNPGYWDILYVRRYGGPVNHKSLVYKDHHQDAKAGKIPNKNEAQTIWSSSTLYTGGRGIFKNWWIKIFKVKR